MGLSCVLFNQMQTMFETMLQSAIAIDLFDYAVCIGTEMDSTSQSQSQLRLPSHSKQIKSNRYLYDGKRWRKDDLCLILRISSGLLLFIFTHPNVQKKKKKRTLRGDQC